MDIADEVCWSHLELKPADPGANIDIRIIRRSRMKPCGERFLHAHRRASAADIPGKGK